jgi:hypothetical protein
MGIVLDGSTAAMPRIAEKEIRTGREQGLAPSAIGAERRFL